MGSYGHSLCVWVGDGTWDGVMGLMGMARWQSKQFMVGKGRDSVVWFGGLREPWWLRCQVPSAKIACVGLGPVWVGVLSRPRVFISNPKQEVS